MIRNEKVMALQSAWEELTNRNHQTLQWSILKHPIFFYNVGLLLL
jgi:hypothetical protein